MFFFSLQSHIMEHLNYDISEESDWSDTIIFIFHNWVRKRHTCGKTFGEIYGEKIWKPNEKRIFWKWKHIQIKLSRLWVRYVLFCYFTLPWVTFFCLFVECYVWKILSLMENYTIVEYHKPICIPDKCTRLVGKLSRVKPREKQRVKSCIWAYCIVCFLSRRLCRLTFLCSHYSTKCREQNIFRDFTSWEVANEFNVILY